MPMEVLGSTSPAGQRNPDGLRRATTESISLSGPRSRSSGGGWERMPTVYSQSGLRQHWQEQQAKRSAQVTTTERSARSWVEPPYPLDVLTNLFLENVDFYSVVEQLATDAAGYGWDLVDVELPIPSAGDVDRTATVDTVAAQQRAEGEPWIKGLAQDHHRQPISMVDLWKSVLIDLGSTGLGPVEVSRDAAGMPDGLYQMPARLARMLKEGDGWVQIDENGKDVSVFRNWGSDPSQPSSLVTPEDAQRYKAYRDRVGMPKNELKVFKNYNPNEERYGIPPIVAALIHVYGNIYSRHRNLRFFINRAMPEWLIQVEAEQAEWQDPELAGLIQSSIDELQEHLQMVVEGDDYRMVIQKVPIDRVKFNWQEISTRLQYSDVQGYETDNRDAVIRAYRVPPARLGIIETANLGSGSGENQQETYKTARIDALQGMIEEFMNQLLDEKGLTAVRFKFRELDVVDERREIDIFGVAWQSKCLSINEGREWLSRIVPDQDFPPWDEDEEAAIPIYIVESLTGGAVPGSVGGFGAPGGDQFAPGGGRFSGRSDEQDPELGGILRRLSDGLRQPSEGPRRFSSGGNNDRLSASAASATTARPEA